MTDEKRQWGDPSEQEGESVMWKDPSDETDAQETDREERPKKQSLIDVFVNTLPTALSKLVMKHFLLAIGSLLVTILFMVTIRRPETAIFLVVTVWSVWSGVSVIRDFRAGKILERVLVCTNVSYSVLNNRASQTIGKYTSERVRVTFRDTNDPPAYCQFVVPGRKTGFIVDTPYVTYVRRNTPQILMAYIQL